nr:hypothetical protein [Candidatus Sigynarchaeota archaeon]
MLIVDHIFLEIISLVLFMGIIPIISWAEKSIMPGEQYTCIIMRGLRAFGFIVLVPFALMFWDTIVKELFLGVFGYGNIMHWLGSLALLGFTGTTFILAAIFVAPSRKGLITLGVMVAVFLFLVEFYFPSSEFAERISVLEVVLYTVAAGLVCHVLLASLHGIVLKVTRSGKKDTPLWNFSASFKHIFSRKAIFVLWLLAFSDVVLMFEGYGFLSNTWMIIISVGTLASLVVFKMFWPRYAGRKVGKVEALGRV